MFKHKPTGGTFSHKNFVLTLNMASVAPAIVKLRQMPLAGLKIVGCCVFMVLSSTSQASQSPAGTVVDTGATLQRVEQLAASRVMIHAIEWLQSHEEEFRRWQIELTEIPAPPFGETRRAEWLRDRFISLGLQGVRIDEAGNVIGIKRGSGGGRRLIALTAHIDTVFPPGTATALRVKGDRMMAPGISDNSAGVTALQAIISVLHAAQIKHADDILFVGNVGEEGEGNLRGMRHLFGDDPASNLPDGNIPAAGQTPGTQQTGSNMHEQLPWRDRIAGTVVLDGAGSDTVVTQALGSRRFEITIHGPGGHSWSDFGVPNPIVILARCITAFSKLASSVGSPNTSGKPPKPKTAFNFGVIRGGTSVNSIPGEASVSVDIRSSSPHEIDRLDKLFRQVVKDTMKPYSAGRKIAGSAAAGIPSKANRAAAGDREHADNWDHEQGGLNSEEGGPNSPTEDGAGSTVSSRLTASYEFRLIGERPAGELPEGARILEVIHAVDAHLNLPSRSLLASTDANIPLSLGREAISIGAGGEGGEAHTVHEWYDPMGRALGLKRILLTVLTLAGFED